MLNWIWMGLIAIAVFVATGRDIAELSNDRFRNGKELSFNVIGTKPSSPGQELATLTISKDDLKRFYGDDEIRSITADTITLTAEIVVKEHSPNTTPAVTNLLIGDTPPAVWKDMAAVLGEGKKISGTSRYNAGDSIIKGTLSFTSEPVRFRILAKVATDGIIKMAEVSVTLAIGLIGIMAFWLGIMKIAEAAGLVRILAKAAKPIMVRLFPDVPPEHPAMGAMLSNMAANFLGLSNAATPLGLKAMEELNKLNTHQGIATNAMCTFLTINTSAITLVPTTVIAVRASLGSSNPTDILVPTFIAAVIAMTCAVIFNRSIQRFFPIR